MRRVEQCTVPLALWVLLGPLAVQPAVGVLSSCWACCEEQLLTAGEEQRNLLPAGMAAAAAAEDWQKQQQQQMDFTRLPLTRVASPSPSSWGSYAGRLGTPSPQVVWKAAAVQHQQQQWVQFMQAKQGMCAFLSCLGSFTGLQVTAGGALQSKLVLLVVMKAVRTAGRPQAGRLAGQGTLRSYWRSCIGRLGTGGGALPTLLLLPQAPSTASAAAVSQQQVRA